MNSGAWGAGSGLEYFIPARRLQTPGAEFDELVFFPLACWVVCRRLPCRVVRRCHLRASTPRSPRRGTHALSTDCAVSVVGRALYTRVSMPSASVPAPVCTPAQGPLCPQKIDPLSRYAAGAASVHLAVQDSTAMQCNVRLYLLYFNNECKETNASVLVRPL